MLRVFYFLLFLAVSYKCAAQDLIQTSDSAFIKARIVEINDHVIFFRPANERITRQMEISKALSVQFGSGPMMPVAQKEILRNGSAFYQYGHKLSRAALYRLLLGTSQQNIVHKTRLAMSTAKRGTLSLIEGGTLALGGVVGVLFSRTFSGEEKTIPLTWGSATGNVQLVAAACYFAGIPGVAMGLGFAGESRIHLAKAVELYNKRIYRKRFQE